MGAKGSTSGCDRQWVKLRLHPSVAALPPLQPIDGRALQCFQESAQRGTTKSKEVINMIIITANEARKLLAVIPPRSPFGTRDRAIIIFLLHTGLRVGELCALNVGHVVASSIISAVGRQLY